MEEKIYFMPGDLCTLKQDIPYKPTMIVVGKKTTTFKVKSQENKEEILKGIICRWFASDYSLQEGVFNTKDLLKL